jgi:hypothetical protein
MYNETGKMKKKNLITADSANVKDGIDVNRRNMIKGIAIAGLAAVSLLAVEGRASALQHCLGIIYTRTDTDISETEIYNVQELYEEYETPVKKVGEREVTTVKHLKSITSVIKDFDFFVAEKWKIASDKQGSGNTANIGCTLNLEDLKAENGIFSQLGENWFDEYWINFGSATMIKDGKTVKITNLRNFMEFKGRTDLLEKITKKY